MLHADTGELIWRNKADEQPSARVNSSPIVLQTREDGRELMLVASQDGML